MTDVAPEWDADMLALLLKTPEGRLEAMPMMERARLGLAANQLVGYLDLELNILRRPITGTEAENMANIVFWCLHTAPDEQVLNHLRRYGEGK